MFGKPRNVAMKVLLSAYACEPNKGSEPGIGWHWVVETALLRHEVWVLTRANNRASIERASASPPNLHIVYHDPPSWLGTLKKKGPFLQLYYAFWQWSAYRKARELHQQEQFDVVQHVTFGSFRHASFMGRLGIPFIFGPVGGGERTPIRLRMDYGLKGHFLDAVRDLANVVANWNPWLREMFATAHLILVKTPETGAALPSRYHHKVRQLIEIGAPREAAAPPAVPHDRGIRFLYVGRFLFWKGMQYGLRAFARLLRQVPNARLTIVGAGPDGQRWRRIAQGLNISHAVDWNAWIQHDDLGSMYESHDVFVFPSLHDSSGSVVLEAMSYGLPVVCFDLGGPGVLVTEQCGIVIPTDGQTPDQLIAALANAMSGLARHPDRFRALQHGAVVRARELTWAAAVKQVYGEMGLWQMLRSRKPCMGHGV
jgi:glycosyltransferase involved in cell wall biosynthesis